MDGRSFGSTQWMSVTTDALDADRVLEIDFSLVDFSRLILQKMQESSAKELICFFGNLISLVIERTDGVYVL